MSLDLEEIVALKNDMEKAVTRFAAAIAELKAAESEITGLNGKIQALNNRIQAALDKERPD